MSIIKAILLDKEIKDKLINDFVNNKLSISELSRRYNLGRAIIRKTLEKENVYEKRFIITWTSEMDEKLISVYDEFHDINDLMKIMGMSKDTIKRRAKKLGLTKQFKVKWLTPEIKEQLANWNGEESISNLAKKLGINSETLREYLKK